MQEINDHIVKGLYMNIFVSSTNEMSSEESIFQQKYDITKLQNPAEVQTLVQKYVIMSDVQNAAATLANNPGVSLITDAVNSGSGAYVPATLDISAINMSAFSASKLYG